MSYPTVAEKLASLKVTPATPHELKCMELVSRGAYEIAVQRTAVRPAANAAQAFDLQQRRARLAGQPGLHDGGL